MPTRLDNAEFMRFPLQISAEGSVNSSRRAHVREQIEQVLFTHPGERWFRPEFGVGIRALLFEPNGTALWELTKKRLLASLADALRGEVEASSIEVKVEGVEEKLLIVIAYSLAAINHTEKVEFMVNS